MNILTGNKTLIVGALSLIGAATASIFAHQQSDALAHFTNSAAPTHVFASNSSEIQSYILQGGTRDSLVSAIEKVGATVAKEFPIIGAVSALLTEKQADMLAANNITLTTDREIRIMSVTDMLRAPLKKPVINTQITTQTNANSLHQMGVLGQGVTIAVLDSGSLLGGEIGSSIRYDSNGIIKSRPKYNTFSSTMNRQLNDDENGHGTHISNIIGSSLQDEDGNFNGMAPNARLMSIKAFDARGNGSYSNVLDGLNWIFHNRNRYNIDVLNLSLGADVNTNYWNDPINQAVMRLWAVGVVVVTSAGNSGSGHTTITAPGNVPYVITVGAVTDSYTPADFSDDRMTTFSSQGPTHEGFVKPELVSYGGHIEMKMDKGLLAKKSWFESLSGESYYGESGTSQAAAIVTGIVALMLDHTPGLSPDDVKCRLMASAQPMNDPVTNSKYSPFAQGSGMANAYNSVMSNASGCANRGLDIRNDVNGEQHFQGPALINQSGEVMIDFGNGNIVAEGSVWGGGTNLEGSVWGGGTILEGSVWGGGTILEGSVWGGGTILEGSVWGGGTNLEGSVWGGGTMLEGSVWGGGTNLEGSVWGGGTNLEGSVWGGGTNLEGSIWGNGIILEGSIWGNVADLENVSSTVSQE